MQNTVNFVENSFFKTRHFSSFFSSTNSRENRLFASEWAVDEKKATHNVKIYVKYFTFCRSAQLKSPLKQG